MSTIPQTGFDYIYSEIAQGRFGISEMVFRKIWEAIVTQEIPPGEKLTEEYLSKTFDVSRTPLREAIQRLVEVGMIVKQNNRTLMVSELNHKNLRDLSSVKEHIESLIAYEIWEKHQAGELNIDTLKEWNERLAKFVKMEDRSMVVECHLAFHREMRALSGNRMAKMALEKILLGLEPYRYLANSGTESGGGLMSDHTDLLTAIEGKNGAKAEEIMRAYNKEETAFYASKLKD